MADLAAGVIFGIGKKFVRSLKKVKTNKEGARKVESLINLVDDVLDDASPLYEDGRIKRDPKVTLVMTRLKCGLVEGEKVVDGCLRSNMFMQTVRVDEMADMLVSLRQEIKDLMDVLLHASVNELHLKVDAIMTSLPGDGQLQERRGRNDTRVGCQLVLTRSQLRERQRADTDSVSKALGIHPGVAAVLLRSSNWDPERVVKEWRFQDGENLRRAVGLPPEDAAVSGPEERECSCHLCSGYGTVISAGCSHYYCEACWGRHISLVVRTGMEECLSLRCPSCPMPVIQELVDMVPLQEEDSYRHATFALWSYVVHSGGRIKWCPGLYCVRAIEFLGGGKDDQVVVACDLKHRFCWSCGEEPHGPLACYAPGSAVRNTMASSSHHHCRMARELGITDDMAAELINFLSEAFQVMDECRVNIQWVERTRHLRYYHPDPEHDGDNSFDLQIKEANDWVKSLEVFAKVWWFNLYSDRIENEASNDFYHQLCAFKENVEATTNETRDMVNVLVRMLVEMMQVEAVETDDSQY